MRGVVVWTRRPPTRPLEMDLGRGPPAAYSTQNPDIIRLESTTGRMILGETYESPRVRLISTTYAEWVVSSFSID